MLFDVPFLADWTKIGEYRQRQTDKNTARENNTRIDWDYQPGDKVLLRKDGILRKSESRYESDPWTITSVYTNGTIRVQRRTKSERLNIRRVTPFLAIRLNSNKCYFNGLAPSPTQHLHFTYIMIFNHDTHV